MKKKEKEQLQEKLGCCPMMFSVYKKFKEKSDVK